jgi:hypothetical protein
MLRSLTLFFWPLIKLFPITKVECPSQEELCPPDIEISQGLYMLWKEQIAKINEGIWHTNLRFLSFHLM